MKSAKGNSRIPAVEVLISTPLIRDYIVHEDKTASIRDAIAAGTSQYGMQTFDQSLFYLYQSGLIGLDEALRGSTNPDEFRLRLSGIHNTTTLAKKKWSESRASVSCRMLSSEIGGAKSGGRSRLNSLKSLFQKHFRRQFLDTGTPARVNFLFTKLS